MKPNIWRSLSDGRLYIEMPVLYQPELRDSFARLRRICHKFDLGMAAYGKLRTKIRECYERGIEICLISVRYEYERMGYAFTPGRVKLYWHRTGRSSSLYITIQIKG